MTGKTVKVLLGLFFLGTAVALAAYINLWQGSWYLPITEQDATSAFQIIIPMLVGQVAVVWRASMAEKRTGQRHVVAAWLVVAPPLVVLVALAVTIARIVSDQGATMNSGAAFNKMVTLCVTILTVTSVVILAKLCEDRAGPQNDRLAGD
jgi:hypothetical protein